MDIEVKPHPAATTENELWNAIVTTRRGRCYFVTYAGEKPSIEKVSQAWRDDRNAFDPYLQ